MGERASRRPPPRDKGTEEEGEQTKHNRFTLESSPSGQTLIAEAGRAPYLVCVTSEEAPTGERVFVLGHEERVLGRSRTCAIHLSGEGISRRHARIVFDADEYWVEDLGSANGTFLNGRKIAGLFRLTQGDRIRLGAGTMLRFEWPGLEEDFDDGQAPHSVRRPSPWSPTSWTTKPIAQAPTYDDAQEVDSVVHALRRLPPLVTPWEIDRLKELIADAQAGNRFLLQGGDCAETIAECAPPIITNKLKILLQMSLILTHATRKPVIRIGRFAGQYAKPRSKPTEVRGGVELPSYYGDLVNHPEFTAEARRADPRLLLNCYEHAALTLNFIRSLCDGGFSDARHPEYFDLQGFDRANLAPSVREEYSRMRRQVADGLHFLRAMGGRSVDELSTLDFFTSHEGLNLIYESAQTHKAPNEDQHYCLTTHLPWIGDRTRQLTGAHIEFFRGIANPIGVKVGPSTSAPELVRLLGILNPDDEAGKIILIVRMGAGALTEKLPPLVHAVTRARRRVLWVSDPMHGNSATTKSGVKTRNFDEILQEVVDSFSVHEKCGTRLGGVHFELTGDDVTECIGAGLTEADLDTRYLTKCDPRLNYRQAMEIAFLVARRIAGSSAQRPSSPPAESV